MSTATATPTKTRTTYTLPIKPLWDIAFVKADRRMADSGFDGTGFTPAVLADMIGYDPKSVSRWLAKGALPERAADEAATALNLHPIHIWGDDWLNVKGDLDDILAGKYDAAIARDLDRAFGAEEDDQIAAMVAESLAG